MKRKALYSRATRRRSSATGEPVPQGEALDFWQPEEQGPRLGTLLWQKVKAFNARHDRAVPATAAVLIVFALMGGWQLIHPAPAPLTQYDIDNAVKYTLGHTPQPPDNTTIAAAIVAPSVVRVDGYLSPEHAAALAKEEAEEAKKNHIKLPPVPKEAQKDAKNSTPGSTKEKDNSTKTPDGKEDEEHPDSTGSGVVIDEKGDILTNLHVVSSTDRWVVTFADGSKSDAVMVNSQPENDLAVIKAKTQPDDLKAATLASTRDLYPGDTVVATGFPFGIGPSVSSGVVAGLKRSFVDPTDKDKPKMTNLIQFDAAVNPGNSGGPLVNRDGEVVGIVTAIYNPTGQHVFAGMAFAVPIENAARAAGENPL
ncbi:MAG TPA: trypsin-like peptidase domain-containing protein [Rhizomicrobium sp.]|nr:trypsin-like peptidase domain-containing protein [Rhizomicrobium sp.]HWC62177.1 trypsin-like peptidase domain-containing protein [Rhizomicrobium sp.]